MMSLRACLCGGGGHQISEVTRLGGEKITLLYMQSYYPRHPGVHFLKISE